MIERQAVQPRAATMAPGEAVPPPLPPPGESSALPASALFPTSRPLAPGELIGRNEEVAALVDGLARGEHHALSGSRHAGKSSVARTAAAALEATGWQSITVDLFATHDLTHLIAGIAGPASSRPPSLHSVRSTAAEVECVPAPTSGSTSAAGPRFAPAEPVAGPEEEVSATKLVEALRRVNQLAEANDQRVVLLIDEFQEIVTTQLFGRPDELIAAVRTSMAEATRVSCLVVSGIHDVANDLFSDTDPGLGAFDALTTLSPIPAAAWQAGLRSRFRRGGCDIDDAALQHLLGASQGHPRSTMLIAQLTYARATAGGSRSVDLSLVEHGLQAALEAQAAVNRSELARVRTLGKHTLATTLRVARAESPYKHLAPAIARQTLGSLEATGVVEHAPREWRISDPLFQSYLLNLSVDGAVDPAQVALGAEADAVARDGSVDEAADPAGPTQPASAETDLPGAARAPEAGAEHIRREVDGGLRHPRHAEADVVGQFVAAIIASGSSADRDAARPGQPLTAADERSGRRFGRFIARMVARDPERYWQLDVDGQPQGGLVVYRPRALIGRGTSVGIDPLLQLALLAAVVMLALGGIGLLLAARAWEWGGLGGLLTAGFIGCVLFATPLARGVLGRAIASWIARRHGGAVVEGVWAMPQAMSTVFEALAAKLPGTMVAAYAATSHEVPAYRALGFEFVRGGVMRGVLDPQHARPLRSASREGPGRPPSSRRHPDQSASPLPASHASVDGAQRASNQTRGRRHAGRRRGGWSSKGRRSGTRKERR